MKHKNMESRDSQTTADLFPGQEDNGKQKEDLVRDMEGWWGGGGGDKGARVCGGGGHREDHEERHGDSRGAGGVLPAPWGSALSVLV